MTETPTPRTPSGTSRRSVLTAAAWATPTIAFAAAAPAMAASPANQQFGVVFDGGRGINGWSHGVYFNLRSATGSSVTLTAPVTITIDVVGLTGSGNAERSFSAASSNGEITRSSYNQATRTTTITWVVPVGTVVPTSRTDTANPDIRFNFLDGGHSGGRIENKLVVRSISGGRITDPSSLPIDSTVVGDESGSDPDGIY